MTGDRDGFLKRVQQAVADGNRAGHTAALEPRGNVGYQGAGSDPAGRFAEMLAALGGHPHMVADAEAATAQVMDLVRARSPRRVLLGSGHFIDPLGLRDRLTAAGVEVVAVNQLTGDTARPAFFDADLGISGVDYLIAETGTAVVLARPDQPRSVSLLPPVHIAVAERSQLLPDLFDLFDRLGNGRADGPSALPSTMTLITGPSKTGDIELRLVTGVHGPGHVHVVLYSESVATPDGSRRL